MKKHFSLRSLLGVSWFWVLACGGSIKQVEPALSTKADEPLADVQSHDESIDLAQELLKQKEYTKARNTALELLKKSPQNADAFFILGVCDEAEKKTNDAIEHYNAALKNDAKQISAATNLSALFIELNRFDEAEHVLQNAIKIAPKHPDLYVNLAYTLKGKNDFVKAAQAFAQASELKPNDAQLYLWQAETWLEAKELESAQRAYRNAIAHAETHADLIAMAAVGLAKSGDAAGCVVTFNQAIAIQSTPGYLTERAICKHKAKDLSGARKDLVESLAQKPSLKAHAAAAKYAEEAGDRTACFKHYNAVIVLAKGTKLEEQARRGTERCSQTNP